MAAKLLPCPECGGTDIRPPVPEKDDNYVWCKNGRCKLYDVEYSVRAWNTRHKRPKAVERKIELHITAKV